MQAINLRLLCKQLSKAGFMIAGANNGLDGRQSFRSLSYMGHLNHIFLCLQH